MKPEIKVEQFLFGDLLWYARTKHGYLGSDFGSELSYRGWAFGRTRSKAIKKCEERYEREKARAKRRRDNTIVNRSEW